MPASLAARPDAQALVPEWAGIISCRIRQRAGYAHYDARVIRKPKQNRKAPKHTDSYRLRLARLGVLRYWSGERKRVTGGAA